MRPKHYIPHSDVEDRNSVPIRPDHALHHSHAVRSTSVERRIDQLAKDQTAVYTAREAEHAALVAAEEARNCPFRPNIASAAAAATKRSSSIPRASTGTAT